jgi:hypothetical protein
MQTAKFFVAGVLDARRPAGAWVQPWHGSESPIASGKWAASNVISVWEAYVQTMIAACQRRGESDQVASWMYQQCALIPESAASLQGTLR